MKNIIFLFLFLTHSAFAERIRLISVSGSAEKSFEPDMARILINAWGKADNAKTAQVLSNTQYEQLKKAIESFQVKAADVQTIGYELSPDYSYDNKTGTNKILGYTAIQTIRVKFKKATVVGKFLDEMIVDTKNLKSGIAIQSVTWDLEKREEIQKNLLSEAVKNAHDQAELLAIAANVKIKNLYHLNPQENRQGTVYLEDSLKASGGGRPSTAVFAGEVKVHANVSADYEIE